MGFRHVLGILGRTLAQVNAGPLGAPEPFPFDTIQASARLRRSYMRSRTTSNTTAARTDCGSAYTVTGRINSRLLSIGSLTKFLSGSPWNAGSVAEIELGDKRLVLRGRDLVVDVLCDSIRVVPGHVRVE